jgi:hypothetical protein
MTTSTLSLQSMQGSTNDVELNKSHKASINGRTYQTSFAEQISGKSQIELNGEDFVLLGLNSPNPRFANNNKKGTQSVVAYKKAKEDKGANELKEIGGGLFASAMLALLPMGELLEQFKTIMEMAHKSKEESGTKIGFTFTQNIDPKAAINPNKSFLPSSPFNAPSTPTPSLWDRVRKESKELKEKNKKKKSKGLGSF